MARQEMLMARCDRKECHTVVEIERSTEAPDGWLEIRVEVEGKFDNRSKLEFCSEKCVAIWARNRKNYKSNGHDNTTPKEQVWAAIRMLHEDKGEFISAEIQSLTGLAQSTVDRWIHEGLEANQVVILAEGEGKNPRHYSIQ